MTVHTLYMICRILISVVLVSRYSFSFSQSNFTKLIMILVKVLVNLQNVNDFCYSYSQHNCFSFSFSYRYCLFFIIWHTCASNENCQLFGNLPVFFTLHIIHLFPNTFCQRQLSFSLRVFVKMMLLLLSFLFFLLLLSFQFLYIKYQCCVFSNGFSDQL